MKTPMKARHFWREILGAALMSASATLPAQECATSDLSPFCGEMRTQARYEKADNTLNAVYRQVLDEISELDGAYVDTANLKEKFVEAQRQWIRFRDAECDAWYQINQMGTDRGVDQLNCLIDRTESRTGQLQKWIAYLPNAGRSFMFAPEKGVAVKVIRPDAAHIKLTVLPTGESRQIEVSEGNEPLVGQFVAEDFNFDGYPDLAVLTAAGMVNQIYDIFLYRPNDKTFEPLLMPRQGPASNCGKLLDVTVLPDAQTLSSSCRSGPTWYADAYRYAQDGRLYFYGSTRVLWGHVADALCPGGGSTETPAVIAFRYAPDGGVEAQKCIGYGNWENIPADSRVRLTVRAATLALYDAPDSEHARRHLVAGDVVEVIDVSHHAGPWLAVRFHNSRRGVMQGWIQPDAGDIAAPP